MDGTISSTLRAGLAAYDSWSLRPSSTASARTRAAEPASAQASSDGVRKRFSLRLGKFSLSYREMGPDLDAPDIDAVVQAAQGLAEKRRADAFACEVEVAALREDLFDPDSSAQWAPTSGIMQRTGVDAYTHAARCAEQDGRSRTLIGVV